MGAKTSHEFELVNNRLLLPSYSQPIHKYPNKDSMQFYFIPGLMLDIKSFASLIQSLYMRSLRAITRNASKTSAA
jgi:hypothetical protein